ncbi:ribose/proton symporter RbsU [Latilactobacillus curvatus]|uniref:ribose/proton symporter RbsU n=1 Tax=Latilactobacillus curvatus TaxID=28038 RepID=UPI0021A97690|nr:ribose transporter RbsU [Latilactobacillus curvatus]MCT3526910.1 ribose uptake protein RbsU [Latilactobacillus curvatus]MDG2986863.1 L-rhamnose-proton symporter RhaT [Latilactobacillus curvatus]
MNAVNILIGLMPMIGWGLFPVIVGKIGGKPASQIIGTTLGTLILAIIVAIFRGTPIPGTKTFIFCLISGACWALAQIITFHVFETMGVSRTMPITTGFQLVGASLWGVFILGNWASTQSKLIGFTAIILIILGVYLTAWSEDRSSASKNGAVRGILLLLVGELGYLGYSAFPQAVHADGFQGFLPQALGMAIVGVIFGLTQTSKTYQPFKEATSYKNIFSGFFFAFAALTYLISAQPSVNGLATGFVLSQTSVIFATIGGIYVLKEQKTKKEMVAVLIGLVLVLVAGSVTAFIK